MLMNGMVSKKNYATWNAVDDLLLPVKRVSRRYLGDHKHEGVDTIDQARHIISGLMMLLFIELFQIEEWPRSKRDI